MLSIGNHAVVLLNHRDDIVEEYILEAFREAAEATRTTTLRTLTSLSRSTLRTLTHSLRSTLRTLTGSTLRTCTRSTLRALTATEAEATLLTRTTGVQTIVHHDDARNGLSLGNQVIHDLSGVSLLSPSVFVLTHTVLQIQNGEFLGGVGEVLVGKIYMTATHLLGVG